MKKSNYILSLGALALTSISAFGAVENPAILKGQEGHGGRVWVCYEPKDPITGERKIKSVELMDYKEANGLFNTWKIDLGIDYPGVDDVPAMLEVALKRLTRVDAIRAKKIRSKLAEIKLRKRPEDIDLNLDKEQIRKIPDGQYLLESVNDDCTDKQAAFNKVNPDPSEYQYVFVKQFQDAMSDRDKAGLLLHEAIYNLEATDGATSSDGSRKIVMAISSPMLDEYSPIQYLSFIQKNSYKADSLTIDGASFDQVRVEDNLFFGVLKNDFEFKTVSACNRKYSAVFVSYYLTDPAKYYCDSKTIAATVLAKKGDSMVIAIGKDQFLGVRAGGRVTTPLLSLKPEHVLFDEKSSLLNLYHFRLRNADLEFAEPIQVDQLSFQPNGREITLEFVSNSDELNLQFDNNKSFKFSFQHKMRGNLTLDSSTGNIASAELAEENESDWMSKDRTLRWTDTEGKTFSQKMRTHQKEFGGANSFRRYLRLQFNHEGKVTEQSVIGKVESTLRPASAIKN